MLFVTGNAKSSQGNICGHFVSDKGFVAFYPMKRQADYFQALKQLSKMLARLKSLSVTLIRPRPSVRYKIFVPKLEQP
jgi:hypothetical protein